MDLLNLKNKNAVNFINSNGIIMDYQLSGNKRTVTLKKNGEIIGEFWINGKIDLDTLDMSIYIDEDNVELKSKGLARLMISYMVMCMMANENIRKDQLIYIDSDASGGFWDHIKMSKNRYYSSDRNITGKGYEKKITFSELSHRFHWDIKEN